MENTTIMITMQDEFEAFVYNMFAIDYFKQGGPGYPYHAEDVYRIKDHHVHYDAGFFMCCNPQKEVTTFPIHLAHTDEFALIIDTQTDDLVIDFRLNRDVIMIIDTKQAFMIKVDDMMGILILNHRNIFEQLRACLPPEKLLLPDPYPEEGQ